MTAKSRTKAVKLNTISHIYFLFDRGYIDHIATRASFEPNIREMHKNEFYFIPNKIKSTAQATMINCAEAESALENKACDDSTEKLCTHLKQASVDDRAQDQNQAKKRSPRGDEALQDRYSAAQLKKETTMQRLRMIRHRSLPVRLLRETSCARRLQRILCASSNQRLEDFTLKKWGGMGLHVAKTNNLFNCIFYI
jgi:hypothetical protein